MFTSALVCAEPGVAQCRLMRLLDFDFILILLAFIIGNGSLESLLQGLLAQIHIDWS